MDFIAERVRLRRKELNCTQQDLADAMHLHKQAIYRLEHTKNRTIDPQVLTDLASALGCTEDYLRGKSNAPDAYATGMKTAIIKYAPHLSNLQKDSNYLFEKDPKLFLLTARCCSELSVKDQRLICELIETFLQKAALQREQMQATL